MIDTIKTLQKNISILEDRLSKLEKKSKATNSELGFNVYANNLLNFQVLKKRSLTLANFSVEEKKQIFFQLKVLFSSSLSQNIKFSLSVNNIIISSETNLYQNGKNEVSLSGTFQCLTASKIKIQLIVVPKENKLITLTETSLTVWGNGRQNTNDEFEAIETSENYFLSYITNERLYYKLFNKTIDVEEVEFIYHSQAISHSVCYDSINNIIYMFIVDLNGNLLLINFNNKKEVLIAQNVNKISSCFSNGKIQYSYISNNYCYFGEISNYSVISNTKITRNLGEPVDCYLFYNSQNNKHYLIITNKNENNYLLESIAPSFCSSENICASIDINITTEGNS